VSIQSFNPIVQKAERWGRLLRLDDLQVLLVERAPPPPLNSFFRHPDASQADFDPDGVPTAAGERQEGRPCTYEGIKDGVAGDSKIFRKPTSYSGVSKSHLSLSRRASRAHRHGCAGIYP
jgi:hypothetical protein